MKRVLFYLFFSNSLFAQSEYHFDILTDINSNTKDAQIISVQNMSDKAIILHSDRDYNTGIVTLRLWKSDGTNIENFASSNLFSDYTYYAKPTIIDNHIFFYVGNNAAGNGLYKAKLDSPTVIKVADISENPTLVKFNSKYYYCNDSQHEDGRLYYYNENTNQSTEIQGANLEFYNPTGLTVANNRLFFTAERGPILAFQPYKRELWVSDGTNAGTYRVKEMEKPISRKLGKMGNRVIFEGYDNDNRSLFISDGTQAGTYAFRNIISTNSYTTVNGIYGSGDKAFLLLNESYSNQIWVTDGTDANTKFIGYYKSVGFWENDEIASKDGFIFFTDNSGRLFKSNGESPILLKNLSIEQEYSQEKFKMVHNPFDNNLYFTLSSSFYKTDGTNSGTHIISDKQVLSPNRWENIPFAIASNNVLAYTTPKNNTNLGREIYKISSDTIKVLKDLDSTTKSADIQFLLNSMGKSYFLATDKEATYKKVFETDGTSEGTKNAEIGYLGTYFHFITLKSDLFLLENQNLLKINFTTRDTSLIKRFPNYITQTKPIRIKDKFYFIVLGGTYNDKQLWVSDGTLTGTKLIKNFELDSFQNIATNNDQLYIFTKSNNIISIWGFIDENSSLIFLKSINANDILATYPNFRNNLGFLTNLTGGMELWVTDGTTNGTTKIHEFNSSLNLTTRDIYFTDNFYFYSIYTPGVSTKVWKSNGTSQMLILDLPDAIYNVVDYCLCDGNVYFGLNKNQNYFKSFLYKYDIVNNETTFIDTTGKFAFNYYKNFYCVNNQLYFSAYGNNNEYNKQFLYTSNGTSSGTKDIISLENRPNYYNSVRGGNIFPLNNHELLISVNDKFYDFEWFTFRKCDHHQTISGYTSDSKIKSTNTFINSSEKLIGESRVYYFAPQSITLNSGFSVDSHSIFKAEIKNRQCTNRQ